MSTILWGLVAGVVVGPLARLVLPGKQDMSLIMTIAIGAVGAIGGGLIYDALGGGPTDGIDWMLYVVQVALAAILVLVYERTQASRA